MAGSDDAGGLTVLRAKRFEAVDSDGQVRAVFGSIGDAAGDGKLVGLDMRDRRGSSRLSVVVDDAGSALISFAVGGNEVLVVGASDHGERMTVGPYVTVCDLTGDVVASLHLDEDGRLNVRVTGD